MVIINIPYLQKWLYHSVWVDQRLATVLQSVVTQFTNVCNIVMSLIKNSVCTLSDQKPKEVPGHTLKRASRIHYAYTTSPKKLNMQSSMLSKTSIICMWNG